MVNIGIPASKQAHNAYGHICIIYNYTYFTTNILQVYQSGQIITTSAEVTLNSGLVREYPPKSPEVGLRIYKKLPRYNATHTIFYIQIINIKCIGHTHHFLFNE